MDTMYTPLKQRGLVFHTLMLLILFAGSAFSAFHANRVDVGNSFAVSVIALLAFALPIPVLAYTLFGLLRSYYQLSPEGVRLKWGLRYEEIPIGSILWISPDNQLERPLPLPFLRWPGSVLGTRRLKKGRVEYLAGQARNLIVIATPGKMYAISPDDPEKFMRSFQRIVEVGTVNPIPPRSVYPTFLLGNVWASRPARLLIFLGFFSSFALLLWITLTFPTESGNITGNPNLVFTIPHGDTTRIISQTQILLLPILNALFFLVNLLLGLFFFRQTESQPLAYLLWGTSVLTSLLFFNGLISLI